MNIINKMLLLLLLTITSQIHLNDEVFVEVVNVSCRYFTIKYYVNWRNITAPYKCMLHCTAADGNACVNAMHHIQ